MKEIKARLLFPPEGTGTAVTYHLIKDYDLWVNILHAEIAPTKAGQLVLDMKGTENNLDLAFRYLKSQGVVLEVLNGGINLSRDLCVDCGACTATCPSGALFLDTKTWEIVFQKEKCYVCRSCVTTCPVRAITVSA